MRTDGLWSNLGNARLCLRTTTFWINRKSFNTSILINQSCNPRANNGKVSVGSIFNAWSNNDVKIWDASDWLRDAKHFIQAIPGGSGGETKIPSSWSLTRYFKKGTELVQSINGNQSRCRWIKLHDSRNCEISLESDEEVCWIENKRKNPYNLFHKFSKYLTQGRTKNLLLESLFFLLIVTSLHRSNSLERFTCS